MKPKTRLIPEGEYFALLRRVIEDGRIIENGAPFTNFAMVTDDFLPTQNMAEARFIAWDNSMDCGLLQVDAAGDAIVLKHHN